MAQDHKQLEKVLMIALRTGRCFLGYREGVKNVKGSRLIVLSSRAPPKVVERVERAAHASKTSLYMFPGTPLELGKLLGKRFPVSTLTIRAKGDADLSILRPELAS